ncbi:MAG: hypothetical protein STSR0008_22310 [Ignavibacterium sp.]
MNIDQIALSKWIFCGIKIQEVAQLNGDAAYLLSNMIAKYSLAADTYALSMNAVKELKYQNIDLTLIYNRSKFYGKKSLFIYEHPVPCSRIREEILKVAHSYDLLIKVLEESGPVTIILRSENEIISKKKLTKKMPEGWNWGDDIFARYHYSGIQLSDKNLKVKGGIKR